MFGTKVLEETNSKYNGQVRVVKTIGMETYIQCNGLTQSGGIVETIWKQTIKKISKKKIDIKSILILGLGGGTVAKLLRQRYPDAKIIGIEIDPIMISLGKKYLSLDKYKVDIRIEDALTSKLLNETWDLVVVDTYLGDKYVTISEEKLPKSKLTIFNRLYYGDKKKNVLDFELKLRLLYSKVEVFYPSVNIMFICFS